MGEDTLNQLLDAQSWLTAQQCLQYGLADEIAGKEDKNISAAQQRFEQSIKEQIMQMQSKIKVPEQFQKQKTNAEKMMAIFKKKMEGNE